MVVNKREDMYVRLYQSFVEQLEAVMEKELVREDRHKHDQRLTLVVTLVLALQMHSLDEDI